MSEAPVFDRIIKNVRVVRPHQNAVELLDLGIINGKFAQIDPNISPDRGKDIVNAQGLLGFPGVVDAHMHIGIYQPLDLDAVAETKAAAMGGVTTSLNYIRTDSIISIKAALTKSFSLKFWHYQMGIFLLITATILLLSAGRISMRCDRCLRTMGLDRLRSLCSMGGMVCTVFPSNKTSF